jgi:flagellin
MPGAVAKEANGMSMIINTNVAALNAQRNLSSTNHKMSRTLEKLSSGLRINRAADDAAGLAISEKMRSQVRGMQQGQRNALDGVSMLQTAEGALDEVHNILQRMRELTVQAGNSTLSSTDRQAIGEEMVALRSEIDNIASRTRFNGLNLLNGSLAVTLDGASTASAVTSTANGGTVSVASIDVGNADANSTYTLSNAGAVLTASVTSSGFTRSETFTVQDMGANATQAVIFENLGVTINLSHDANAGNVTGAGIAGDFDGTTVVTTGSSSASFRVGSEVGDDITLSFSDMRSSALGNGSKLDTLIANNNAVSTTAAADTLLAAVDTAIEQVSTFRAVLGARQNQLETAINSLGVSVENLSASESRIRDADIAAVSSDMVTRQIMQQAGVSVLAQANAAPQSVLSLLG